MDDLKVVIFAGSLRKASFNRLLAENTARLAIEGMRIEHILLDGLPNFNQDEEHDPVDIVRHLQAKVKAADGLIIVTPEYNFSVSSVTKSAIDWLSRPYGSGNLDNKPVAIQSASGGYMGGIRAQLHLRQILGFFDAQQVYFPEVFLPSAQDKFDEHGKLKDPSIEGKIVKQLHALSELILKNR